MHDAWTRKWMHAFSVHTLPYFAMLYIPLLLHSHLHYWTLLAHTCTTDIHACMIMHAYIQADIHTNTSRMMCVCVHFPVHKGAYLRLYTQRIGWLERWPKTVGQRSPIWTHTLPIPITHSFVFHWLSLNIATPESGHCYIIHSHSFASWLWSFFFKNYSSKMTIISQFSHHVWTLFNFSGKPRLLPSSLTLPLNNFLELDTGQLGHGSGWMLGTSWRTSPSELRNTH